jgi:hypothetical protein
MKFVALITENVIGDIYKKAEFFYAIESKLVTI